MFDPIAEDRALERVRERVAAAAPRARRRHRMRRVGAIVASAATIAAVSGMYFAVRASQHDIQRAAYCYAGPSLDAPRSEVSSVDVATNVKTGEKVIEAPADPIPLCTVIWSSGIIHHESGTPPKEVPGPVPNLVACVLPDGVPAVFPRTTARTCATNWVSLGSYNGMAHRDAHQRNAARSGSDVESRR